MITSHQELLELLKLVFPDRVPPKPLHLLWAVERVKAGEKLEDVAGALKISKHHLKKLCDSPNPAKAALGPVPEPPPEVVTKVRRKLGELLLGRIAERAFEETYKKRMGTSELKLQDDRTSRTDTDFRVVNGQQKNVCRINIKFYGSPFRKAKEMVGLEPDDCFPLATYKICAALEKQQKEHLSYIFLIVGVKDLTGTVVGQTLPENLVHLTALTQTDVRRGTKKKDERFMTGKQDTEDAVVRSLCEQQEKLAFREKYEQYYDGIQAAKWYVLSARKAELQLKEKLFQRVYAVRVPRFSSNYRNAEVDMHFSLEKDLQPLDEFFKVIRERGVQGLVSMTERGTL